MAAVPDTFVAGLGRIIELLTGIEPSEIGLDKTFAGDFRHGSAFPSRTSPDRSGTKRSVRITDEGLAGRHTIRTP
ncbi:acyl carrier protein [Rhodococcus wratislaviensis IFP 2016]|nr:acyl carrier protein [Rhodococcus wratislaviensis IFP 2016]